MYIYNCSLRAHQRSTDQMMIWKDQRAQTTIRAVGVAYHLGYPSQPTECST